MLVGSRTCRGTHRRTWGHTSPGAPAPVSAVGGSRLDAERSWGRRSRPLPRGRRRPFRKTYAVTGPGSDADGSIFSKGDTHQFSCFLVSNQKPGSDRPPTLVRQPSLIQQRSRQTRPPRPARRTGQVGWTPRAGRGVGTGLGRNLSKAQSRPPCALGAAAEASQRPGASGQRRPGRPHQPSTSPPGGGGPHQELLELTCAHRQGLLIRVGAQGCPLPAL